MTSATISAVHRHDGTFTVVDVQGTKATRAHRWAVKGDGNGQFAPTKKLASHRTELRAYSAGKVRWTPMSAEPVESGVVATVFNLTTTARTFLVAARPEGPYYLVHNTKMVDDDDVDAGDE